MKRLGAFLVGAALIFGAAPAHAQIQPGNGGGGGSGGGGSIVTPLTAADLVCATSTTQAGDCSTITSPALLPVGLSFTSNIAYSGTSIASLGSITGGSGYTQNASILTLGAITAGSGYVQNTYQNVPLTGGTGSGATATIVVGSGGTVIKVSLASAGSGYTAADTLSASNTNLGGSGSGFSIPVSTVGQVYSGQALTGGSGTGATATITVNSSGAVSAVSPSSRGTGYVVNDVLSAAIPGGSGFSVPVTVVSAQSGAGNSWESVLSRTLSGSVYINNSPGTISPYEIYIGADTVDTNNQGLHIIDVEDAPTTGFTGGRIGVHGFITVQGVPASTPGSGLTGVQGNTTINANLLGASGVYTNYKGTAFGGNSQVIGQSKATFISILNGHEFDVSCEVGCSVAEKHAATFTETSDDATAATYDDSAVEFTNQDAAAVTWNYGVSFGGYAHKWPFATTSTLIGAQARSVGSPVVAPVALNGVDFSAVTFQSGGCAFKSTGHCTDPNGNDLHTGTTGPTMAAGTVAIAGLISAPTFGAAGEGAVYATNTNGLNLQGDGVGGSYDVALLDNAGAVALGVITGTQNVVISHNGGFLAVDRTSQINTNDIIAASFTANNARAGFSIDNPGTTNATTSIVLGNSASASEASIILNGGGFSGGLGANAFSIGVVAAGALIDLGTSSETIQLGGSGMWAANGSVATAMSSLGPTGSHTTIQEWFAVKDSAGTTRWIPAF